MTFSPSDSQTLSPDEQLILDQLRRRTDGAETLDQIMEFLFESIRALGKCDRMSFVFLERDRSRVVAYWTRASYEPLVLRENYEENLVGTLLEKLLQEGGTVGIINDLEQYVRDHPGRQIPIRCVAEGLRSSISIPVVVGGKRTIGFLVIRSRTPHAYDHEDERLYRAIVSSISPIVERIYQIEQLTRALHDYHEVLGFVSHELQSPIASMMTDARLLADGYLGEVNERQQQKLQRILAKGEYLLSLVQDYLNMARLEGAEMKLNLTPRVDVCTEVVEPMIELVQNELEQKGMTISNSCDVSRPVADCDIGLMKIAFGNLIKNGVKYGKPGGEIRVTVERENDFLKLTVWNEGPGFSQEAENHLFRKFSRLNEPDLKKEPGSGVGLYTTWRIAQLHRGYVDAKSEKGKWAQFSIAIPLSRPQETLPNAEEDGQSRLKDRTGGG